MIPQLLLRFAADNPALDTPCNLANNSFLNFPTWYQYLPGHNVYVSGVAAAANAPLVCVPALNGLSDIWLIVAAIVEIILRIAALVAIVIIIWGGVDFITSQGDPDKASKARGTIVNALIGLGISVGAAAVVTFIAGGFTK